MFPQINCLLDSLNDQKLVSLCKGQLKDVENQIFNIIENRTQSYDNKGDELSRKLYEEHLFAATVRRIQKISKEYETTN